MEKGKERKERKNQKTRTRHKHALQALHTASDPAVPARIATVLRSHPKGTYLPARICVASVARYLLYLPEAARHVGYAHQSCHSTNAGKRAGGRSQAARGLDFPLLVLS